MLLTIDAGNTNIVFAVFDGNRQVGQWRIATDSRRTSDEYGVWLLQVLKLANIPPEKINGAILASVVPQAIFDLRQFTRHYFNTDLILVGAFGLMPPMAVKVDNPGELGSDRLVNAFAAWQQFRQPLIVVDFGTATTFDVVNDKGEYLGGVIAPGVNLSLDALHKAAAKLPNIGIMPPAKVIGTNTIGAMQSGVYYGYAGLVEEITRRIKEEYKQPMKIVATGGLAPLYAKACTAIDQVEPDLTINGLRELYTLHKEQRAA